MITSLEWLADSRWPLVPLKYLLSERITDGPHETPAFLSEGMPFLSVDGIQDGELTFESCRFVSEEQHREFRQKAAPRRGDILFGKAASTGKIARVKVDVEFSIWSPLALLRPNECLVASEYLEYALKSSVAQGQVDVLVTHNTQNNISMDAIPRIRVPLPPRETQDLICRVLSAALSPIETLLLTKQRLLDLLAEKRKAIIATAVTRGLDPKVKLRDSGVPWLGEIPAHWEIERARWLFRERDVRSTTGEEEMLTVSHLTGVTPRSEKDVNMFEAETNEGYKLCEPGDLVINTLWAWMGAMGIAPMKGIVSPAYNVYEPGPRLAPAYIDALVRLPVFAQEVTRYSKGVWSSRLRLYPEGFFEVYLPIPPQEEQRAVVAHTARETAKLDAVRAATERTIALLKERRSALIAAAVTGQLDVGAAA